jgi:ABC-2 type transport system ATP-binding protein
MVLTVENFSKDYAGTPAVRSLSFHLEPGDIVGLVGPNGAGKTTTMRAIAGIIPPSSGVITIEGHDVRRDPIAAKRALAYVPDDPKLFDALTVWEHLRFIAAAYQVRDFAPEAERLLDQFELREKRDALAMELSRGMRQKVAICCAYLHRPRVVLLDEPLTGLDPRGIRTMKESIRQRARGGGGGDNGHAGGAAFLVSSHLLALVEDLCDKLLILHRGERLFFGRVAEARAAFAARPGADGSPGDSHEDASLEEVFFKATEGAAPASGAAST